MQCKDECPEIGVCLLTNEDLQRAAHIIFEKVNSSTAHANFPPESAYIKAAEEVLLLLMDRLELPQKGNGNEAWAVGRRI